MPGILTILFVVMFALKIAAVTTISWWIVCAPLYPIILFWSFLICCFLLDD